MNARFNQTVPSRTRSNQLYAQFSELMPLVQLTTDIGLIHEDATSLSENVRVEGRHIYPRVRSQARSRSGSSTSPGPFGHFVQMPTQLPADVNLDSPQIKLINEWNRGFMEKNADILANCVHKDFHRVVLPRSMGQPAQNKEEWIKDITAIISFATEFDVGYLACHANSSNIVFR